MKKLLSLTLMITTVFLTSPFVQAHSEDEVEAIAGSLKYNMKQAGTLFKAIGASLSNPAKNSDNAKAAAEMADFFKLAQGQTPEHMNEIPAAQKAEAQKAYHDLMQQCIDQSLALQQSFVNNDNAAAAKIYKELKELKQDGHDQFDP